MQAFRSLGASPASPLRASAQTLDCSVDEREPLGRPLPGTATSVLRLFDRALDDGDFEGARNLRRLLPDDLGSDPAVADRIATLAILAGDRLSAREALARVSDCTPRLTILAAAIALEEGDVVAADRVISRPLAERSLALAVLRCLLHAIEESDRGPRVRSDATVSICRAALEAGIGPADRPRRLRLAIRLLASLLARSEGTATIAGTVVAGLRGVAVDLGLSLGGEGGELAVTAEDRRHLVLRRCTIRES